MPKTRVVERINVSVEAINVLMLSKSKAIQCFARAVASSSYTRDSEF